MTSERRTENLLEQALRQAGFNEDDFQFQGSDDEEIRRFLSSKRGGQDGKGHPEHIIRLNGDAGDLLVTECKADKADHASATDLGETSKLKPVRFAEDGVLHYMKGLRREFNVIGLAVSGTDTLQITTFKALRGGVIERLPNTSVLSRPDYVTHLRNSVGYGSRTEDELHSFAVKLHNQLRDDMELSETLKPLIVSGVLLGLMDGQFESGYQSATSKDELASGLLDAIGRTLRRSQISEQKRDAMMTAYAFIRVDQALKEHLRPVIAQVYRNLFFALHHESSLDLLGKFYSEFLRYSGGDKKGLGIVLTPRHITELFADLADLDARNSVVLDICAGTGGFLIAAMAKMVGDAAGDSSVIERIKSQGLVGVELEPSVFTLACANMIFRGDGKANMFLDNSIVPRQPETETRIRALVPNVALLNPPYAKKKSDLHELSFMKRALDLLLPGGIGIAIVPLGALTDDTANGLQRKKELLESHTLKASMSMPPQLFPGTGTVTAIVVFEAHKAHCRTENRPVLDEHGSPVLDETGTPVRKQVAVAKSPTWFAYWRDDGFVLNKNKRVPREQDIWERVKKEWLDAYDGRAEKDYQSYLHRVTHTDEWVAEAFMKTDYSRLTPAAFEDVLRRYAVFKLTSEVAPEEVGGHEEESGQEAA